MSGRDANQLAADAPEVRAALEMVRALRWELPAAVADDVARRVDELVGLVGTLQQERDDLREERRSGDFVRRAEAAEAALATTRQALTEIAAGLGYPTLYREVARRALAATDSDTEDPA